MIVLLLQLWIALAPFWVLALLTWPQLFPSDPSARRVSSPFNLRRRKTHWQNSPNSLSARKASAAHNALRKKTRGWVFPDLASRWTPDADDTFNTEQQAMTELVLLSRFSEAVARLRPLLIKGEGDCWRAALPHLNGRATVMSFQQFQESCGYVGTIMKPFLVSRIGPVAFNAMWNYTRLLIEVAADGDMHLAEVFNTYSQDEADAMPPQWLSYQQVANLDFGLSSKILIGAGDAVTDAMNLLSGTIHVDAITAELANRVVNDATETLRHSRWSLSPAEADLLRAEGIQATAAPGKSHSHALHKRVEEHFLRTVVPSLVTPTCAVFFCKAGKLLDTLVTGNNFRWLWNPVLTVRDVTRFKRGFVRALPCTMAADSFFFHDAGHYMTPGDVAHLFKRYPGLNRVVMTAIIPPETLHRLPSMFPNVYQLAYDHTDKYHYVLQGRQADSYHQPLSATQWLQCNSIPSNGGGLHGVEVVHSVFAHHAIVVTRDAPSVAPTSRIWTTPHLFSLPAVTSPPLKLADRLLPLDAMREAMYYTLHISAKPENVVSKLKMEIAKTNWKPTPLAVAAAADMLVEARPLLKRASLFSSMFSSYWVMYSQTYSKPSLVLLRIMLILITVLGLFPAWHWEFFRQLLQFKWPVHLVDLNPLPPLIVPSAPDSWINHPLLNSSFGYGTSNLGDSWKTNFGLDGSGNFAFFLSHYVVVLSGFWTGSLNLFYLLFFVVANAQKVDFGFQLWHLFSPASHARVFADELYRAREWDLKTTLTTAVLSPPQRWVLASVDEECEDLESNPEEEQGQKQPSRQEPTLAFARLLHNRECSCSTHSSSDSVCDAGFTMARGSVCHHCSEFLDATGRTTHYVFNSSQTAIEEADRTVDVRNVPLTGFPSFSLPQRKSDTLGPKPKSNCLAKALAEATGVNEDRFLEAVRKLPDSVYNSVVTQDNWDLRVALWLMDTMSLEVTLETNHGTFTRDANFPTVQLACGHYTFLAAKKGLADRFVNTELLVNKLPVLGRLPRLSPDKCYGRKAPINHTTRLFDVKYRAFCDSASLKSHGLRFTKYEVNAWRAKPLIRDMKSGFAGVAKSHEGKTFPVKWTQRVDSLVDAYKNRLSRDIDIAVVYGMPGCGKSYPLQEFLKTAPKLSYKVATPTVENRADWAAGCADSDAWRYGTYETSLLKTAEVMIIDEISMYPPGYIDLACITNPSLKTLVVLGDHCQGIRYESHPEASCRNLKPECEVYLGLAPYYIMYTRRLFRSLASRMSVYTTSDTEGEIVRSDHLPDALPKVLARTADVRMSLDTGSVAYTAVGVQGKTFPEIGVELSRDLITKVSRGAQHAVLTRATRKIFYTAPPSGVDVPNILKFLVDPNFEMSYEQLFASRLSMKLVRRPDEDLRISACDPTLLPTDDDPYHAGQPKPVDEDAPPASAPAERPPSPAPLQSEPAEVPVDLADRAYWTSVVDLPTLVGVKDQLVTALTHFDGRGFRDSFTPPQEVIPVLLAQLRRFSESRAPSTAIFERFYLSVKRANGQTKPLLPRSNKLVSYGAVPTCRGCGRVTSASTENGSCGACKQCSRCKKQVTSWASNSPVVCTSCWLADKSTTGANSYDRAPPLMSVRLHRFDRTVLPTSQPPAVSPPEYDPPSYLVRDDSVVEALVQERLENAREIMLSGLPTNQYRHPAGDWRNLAPHHSTKKDENLFLQTIFARLKRSSAAKNAADFMSSAAAGRLLYRGFCRAFSLCPNTVVPMDWEMMTDCILESQEARIGSKSAQALLRSDARSDPNWARNYFKAFVKSQQKVSKKGPYPGQILAEMPDEAMFLYNPVARYLLRQVLAVKPANMFLAAKSTNADMNRFCVEHWKDAPSHESDATAFDQSQRGEALQFEKLVMWKFDIDPAIVDCYIADKMTLRCQMYTIRTQRLTGEAFTWLFNTLFNIAYTYVRYDVDPSDAQAYGGDDQCVNRLISENASWRRCRSWFRIVVKTVQTDKPTFCSYRFTSKGAFKMPENVLLKALILSEEHKYTSKTANAVGLLQEILPTYLGGDKVYQYFSAAEQAQLQRAALVCKKVAGRYWWWRSIARVKSSDSAAFLSDIRALPNSKSGRKDAMSLINLYGNEDPKKLLRTLRALRPDLARS